MLERFTEQGLYPYSKHYLSKIKQGKHSYWNNHFNTIGVLGMNEACLNTLGVNIIDPQGKQLAIDTLIFIRGKLAEFQEEDKMLYNLESSPAEGCVAGETLIKTVEFGDTPIKNLVGKTFGVWTYSEEKRICIQKAYNVRKTKINTEVLKIVFDNGTELIVTPDHPIAVNNCNRWGQPIIKWIEAKDLTVGKSIKSLTFSEKKDGRFLVNCKQYKANILYEYYQNDKIEENEIIHHCDKNKKNDTKENLKKMTSTDHKKLHAIDLKKNLIHGFGSENSFYGKTHSLETRKKLSEKLKGRAWSPKNISMDEFKKIMSENAKKKPIEKLSKYRKDIDTNILLGLIQQKVPTKEICEKLNCTIGLIRSRLSKVEANHKVKAIIPLKEKVDVYNMEVEDTESYFIDDGLGRGILIHNCTYRFAKADKKQYPDIVTAGNKDPYYTNSTSLPVDFSSDIFEALEHQDELQVLYTGGCVEKGNKVLTNKGLINIEELVVNFKNYSDVKVLSYNPDLKLSEWDDVEGVHEIDVSKSDKINIIAERGLNITTSDWHPFFILEKDIPETECPFCKEKIKNKKAFASHLRYNPECSIQYDKKEKYKVVEKRADELKENDYILQNNTNMLLKTENDFSKDLMWLIGFYISNGSMSMVYDNRGGNNLEKPLVGFFSENRKCLEKCAAILKTNFGCDIKIISDKRSKCLILSINKTNVVKFLTNLNFICGEKVYIVRIPDVVKKNINFFNA
jgi:hypothetical protein